MNLLQMAQRLHRESSRSGNGPTSIVGATKENARLFDWINDAWVNLQSRPVDWRFMRRSLSAAPVTSLQMAYTGAELGVADFGRWRQFAEDEYTVRAFSTTDTSRVWRLHYMPLHEFERRYLDGGTQTPGEPLDWSVSTTDQLLIGPVLDGDTYRIKADYLHEPTYLTADTDVPSMPARFHMLLVWRALVEVGKFENAPDILARASTNFAQLEASLLSDQTRPLTFGGSLA